MVGIVLEGQPAVEEQKRLLEDGKEVNVAMMERDSQGRKKVSRIQFGLGGGLAWVFCEVKKEGTDTTTTLEKALVHEAAELFGGYIERMELRRCLVDPSPLSAAFVEISPCIQDTIAVLEAAFDITVPLS